MCGLALRERVQRRQPARQVARALGKPQARPVRSKGAGIARRGFIEAALCDVQLARGFGELTGLEQRQLL